MKEVRDIILKNVNKSYDGELILENLNLTIPGGKFFALLGPSGCGKTTILRLIAGFESVDSGQIFLGNQEITHMPIYKRRTNTVFQNYALFPHLNVFDNVAFSLKVRKVPKEEIEQRVIKTLKMVHLEGHIYKAIDQLSGGQQQRVALARSMINEPEVLLLDEPLAALDVKLREKMLMELMDLQEALKTTFVYVTHDQLEALTVAERMAIMNYDGAIEQVNTPKKVYESPVSTFVARFVGNTTIIPGTVRITQGKTIVEVQGLEPFDVTASEQHGAVYNGMEIFISIRPEKIEIDKVLRPEFAHHVRGVVESMVYQGYATIYYVRIDNGMRIAVFRQNEEHSPQQIIDYDEHIHLHWHPESVVLLER